MMLVRFHIHMVMSIKMIVPWDVVLCSLVDIGDDDDGGSEFLWNVGQYQTTEWNIPEYSHIHKYSPAANSMKIQFYFLSR